MEEPPARSPKAVRPTRVTIVRARATTPAASKLAETLSKGGYSVKVLVWDRQATLKRTDAGRYAVQRFGLKAPLDKWTALLYFPIWWMYEFLYLLRDDCDVIHACDLETLLPAIPAKLLRRTRLCYTIYDFYASNLPDGRFQPVRRLIRRSVAAVERLGIGFADALFLVDEARYEDVKGARIRRLAYIYNSPPDQFDAKRWHESKGGAEISIFYAGIIGKWRGLDSMIRAIEGLDDVKLTIAGSGSEELLLRGHAAHGDKNVEYTGWIPYDEVIRRTIEADILFAFYEPQFTRSKWASSNKLFEAMMCAKPIIISDGTSMADVVRQENCGLVVPYGDVPAIREAVLRLKNDPELRQTLGLNGRRAYENRYSWAIMESRLLDAYSELAKGLHHGVRKS